MENEIRKKGGVKLMMKLLITAFIPVLLLFIFSVLAIRAVSMSVADKMVSHELNAAQYAFEVAVGNVANGTYMYTNGKFYKGKKNLSENNQFFENFSEQVDLEVSVYYGNTRVASSLVDENGDSLIGGTADEAVVEAVINQGQDYYSDSIYIGGKEYYGMYAPLYQYNKDQIIGMTFVGLHHEVIDSIYTSNMMQNIIFMCAILVISIIVFIAMLTLLIKAIKKVITHLDDVAQGKLTIKIGSKLLERSDEIGDIARSVATLIQSLAEMITNILHTTQKLDRISGNFKDSFGSMTEYITNVDTAVEEMAKGSTQQAQETQNVSSEVQDMGSAIDSTANNVEHLVQSTEKMRGYNRSVDGTLTELIKISDETKDAFDIVFKQTNVTNQSAQEIQTAADVITDIAAQTNLLSLNASIEAARAGEHGRGFAVVADEIRTLAEQSKASASQITGVIDMLIRNSNTTVDTMKKVTEVVEKQSQELNQTKEVFGDLNQEIEVVGDAVDNIRSEVAHLNNIKESVLGAADNLAAIAEENAASTQQTSASMQELSSLVGVCSEDVKQIIEMSEVLFENTNRFKLEDNKEES